MAAIFTNLKRVHHALKTKTEPSLYLAIGRTTPWTTETEPPTPLVTQTTVEELIYIKKITVKHFVKAASGTPDVEVNGVSYEYVADANVYDETCLKVYLSVDIPYNSIAPDTVTFRQIGILLNPTDSDGVVLTDGEYLAANVADQGQLLYVNNIAPVARDSSETEQFDLILNF